MILFLIMLTPLAIAQICSNSYTISGSSCVFNLNNATGCKSIDFLNCSWQECQGWLYSGNSALCTAYVTRYNPNWNECVRNCCQTAQQYDLNWNALQQCQNSINANNQAQRNSLTIILSVIGGVTALIVVVCCIWRCHKNRRTAAAIKSSAVGANSLKAQSERHIKTEKAGDFQVQISMQVWMDAPQPVQKINQSCSVCLQPRVSLQLECGHSYHRSCILECMKRKKECILCRSPEIDKIKVYCQVCLRSYCSTTLMDHLEELAYVTILCLNCKQGKPQNHK